MSAPDLFATGQAPSLELARQRADALGFTLTVSSVFLMAMALTTKNAHLEANKSCRTLVRAPKGSKTKKGRKRYWDVVFTTSKTLLDTNRKTAVAFFDATKRLNMTENRLLHNGAGAFAHSSGWLKSKL